MNKFNQPDGGKAPSGEDDAAACEFSPATADAVAALWASQGVDMPPAPGYTARRRQRDAERDLKRASPPSVTRAELNARRVQQDYHGD